ncbi:MAG: SpoIIE family protein phosphatase [Candidatus Aminicenantes bacterium]|nr:SpoIIE family protein phosphatase [Candidatus Aminicenantes bacterium]
MPTKILVVDDEPDMQLLIKKRFSDEIKRKEYEFDFALNGKDALEKIEKDDAIDLILLDINMPVMDGLTFLSKLNEMDKPLLKTIIITAFGDMQNIRLAMNRGAFDFVTKPIDFEDLKRTIDKCCQYDRKYIKYLIRKNTELMALEKEIEKAAEIQSDMFPKNFLALQERREFSFFPKIKPAKVVGGDFYDFFFIDRNRFGIVVGDVEGKGIPAALFMAISKNIINNTALKGIPPDTCLETVNKELFKISHGHVHVTVFYGILDGRDGSFEYCNGGHLPPFLISSDGRAAQLEEIGGTMLVSFEEWNYDSKRIMLKPGDTIFVYTDGVTEAMRRGDKEGKEFGAGRLQTCLQDVYKQPVEEITKRVIEQVLAFSPGEQTDDITCMTLRYNGKPGNY